MKAFTTAAYPILSKTRIVLISSAAALMVGGIVLLAQWVIYDDLLHRSGPIRIIGTVVSGMLTFTFTYRWQSGERQRQLDTVRRFETIARMNDRIRNSLQAIACLAFVSQPDATNEVQEAVKSIDTVLREVLTEMQPGTDIHVATPSSDQSRAISA